MKKLRHREIKKESLTAAQGWSQGLNPALLVPKLREEVGSFHRSLSPWLRQRKEVILWALLKQQGTYGQAPRGLQRCLGELAGLLPLQGSLLPKSFRQLEMPAKNALSNSLPTKASGIPETWIWPMPSLLGVPAEQGR